MGSCLLDTGLIRVTVKYVRPLKPGAPLSYCRRIPPDLMHHYEGKTFIRKSLQTRNMAEATRKAAKLDAEYTALWASLRSTEGKAAKLTTAEVREGARALLDTLGLAPGDLMPGVDHPEGYDPSDILTDHFGRRYGEAYLEERHDSRDPKGGQRFYNAVELEALRILRQPANTPTATLSDALSLYLREHDRGDDPKFAADATRCINHVFEVIGDFPLTHYRREHASKVRDTLLKSGNKTTTVRRRLNTIKAVINKARTEFDLTSCGNPFNELPIPKEEQDSIKRPAFTPSELKTIVQSCRQADDDIRHIIAMQADTGTRLQEIVGLRFDDLRLDHEVPHIVIRIDWSVNRRLKNDITAREIPLLGNALWAAHRVFDVRLPNSTGRDWLFPRYAEDGKIKNAGASQAVNKWLREKLKINKTSHSFRHTMRDRLRHAGVPVEFQDLIGGWGSRSEGQKYGEGYTLKQLQEQLAKAVVPD